MTECITSLKAVTDALHLLCDGPQTLPGRLIDYIWPDRRVRLRQTCLFFFSKCLPLLCILGLQATKARVQLKLSRSVNRASRRCFAGSTHKSENRDDSHYDIFHDDFSRPPTQSSIALQFPGGPSATKPSLPVVYLSRSEQWLIIIFWLMVKSTMLNFLSLRLCR